MLQFYHQNVDQFHDKVDILESIWHKDRFTRDFIDICMEEFLGRILSPTSVESAVIIVLTYLNKLSFQI